jgi:hypothetical protein
MLVFSPASISGLSGTYRTPVTVMMVIGRQPGVTHPVTDTRKGLSLC